VVSTTLQEATWTNSTIIRENVAGELQAMKDRYSRDILVYGSGQLTRFLLERGLVDRLNLLVYPVTVGHGKRLFGEAPLKLRLTGSRTFSSGVVLVQYVPDTA
jgi:dihydrofolate reductase